MKQEDYEFTIKILKHRARILEKWLMDCGMKQEEIDKTVIAVMKREGVQL